MMQKIAYTFLLAISALSAFGQGQIGFGNPLTFPAVVVQGQTYTISGWIVNRGTLPLTGTIDIRMQVNQSPSLPVDNNFSLPGPLAPGDSVLWVKNNHGFPPGHLSPGHNDVLIWPTHPNGNGLSDSTHVASFFANNAAFSLLPEGLEIWGTEGIGIREHYDLQFKVANVGMRENDEDLTLYMQISGHPPLAIGTSAARVLPGGECTFGFTNFKLESYLTAYYREIPSTFSADIFFFVKENNGMDFVNGQTFPTKLLASQENTESLAAPLIGPNPSSTFWGISYSPEAYGQIHSMELFDLQGRAVAQFGQDTYRIDLDGIAKGNYVLRIVAESNAWTLRVSRQ